MTAPCRWRRRNRSARSLLWNCRLCLNPSRTLPGSAANMPSILIVDDESGIRQSLQGALEDEGYKAAVAQSGEECLEMLRKRSFDVILLDIWLTGIDGLETLQKIKEMDSGAEVIMISGHGTIETAVRATKSGAFDFLEKPLSLAKTLILIKNAIDTRRLRQENVDLKRQLQYNSVVERARTPQK